MKPPLISRRAFIELATCGAVAASEAAAKRGIVRHWQGSNPVLRMIPDRERPLVKFVSWDTEGGGRSLENLLRAGSGVTLRIQTGGQWHPAETFPSEASFPAPGRTHYRIRVAPGFDLLWRMEATGGYLTFVVSSHARGHHEVTGVELLFPFDPRVTPTTVLPSAWNEDRSLLLPAVVSAPDFGQMLLSGRKHSELKGRLEGSRKNHTVNLILELPTPLPKHGVRISLHPIRLDPPEGMQDEHLWLMARRGWFNAWQSTAKWGEANRPFSSPAGILANNVISDPCSMALPFYADAAFWTPEIAPGISVARLARESADWWMDQRTSADGVVTGYWNYKTFLDANTGPILTAWDYVEATGDNDWLERRRERLEFIADYLARRDVDGDGLVEALQSGNPNTLFQPARGCSWWDAVNSGHKDGYTNALIYRAWRCLADLESRLGRNGPAARYNRLADKLKAAYTKALYNPKTGWLGWWRDANGKLHDYATPVVNGLAIEYGLIEPRQGKQILARLWKKIHEVGFERFDLGLPCVLTPIHRGDYLLPDSLGCPKKEDGTDTFEIYMNGGITAGQILHFLAAHYVIGEPEKADHMLYDMLLRQKKGKFQDGVQNKFPDGIDWTTWTGKPCGYEGYLADVYFFLQAIVLREAPLRSRYYRPLGA